MKKSPEKKSLVDKINSRLKEIAVGTALIAVLGFVGVKLTGCKKQRPNNDLEKIENTNKPDSLAYNPDSPDSTDYTMFEQDVKNADSVSKIVDQDLQQSIKELNAEIASLEQAQLEGKKLGKENEELKEQLANRQAKLRELQVQYNSLVTNN